MRCQFVSLFVPISETVCSLVNSHIFFEYAQVIEMHIKDNSVSHEEVIKTLYKILLADDLPKLNNYATWLSTQIGKLEDYKYLSLIKLQFLASNLIALMLDAGAKNSDAPFRNYIAYLKNPVESLNRSIITNKIVTKQKILTVLYKHEEDHDLLTTWDEKKLSDIAKGYRKFRN